MIERRVRREKESRMGMERREGKEMEKEKDGGKQAGEERRG